jgi:hypothetical protein
MPYGTGIEYEVLTSACCDKPYNLCMSLQLTLLVVLSAGVTFAQNTRLGKCDLAVLGGDNKDSFLAFDRELRAALVASDSVAMAFLVRFPLRVNTNRGTYSIDGPDGLAARFNEVFPRSIRAAILKDKLEDLFCNYGGLMYGNGRIWVNLHPQGFAINVVNLPDSRGSLSKLVFACQTDLLRIAIDVGDQSSLRYRVWNKPRSVTGGKPDLEILKGTVNVEGTGPCVHPIWTFATGDTTHTVFRGGCFPGTDQPPEGVIGFIAISVNGKTGERSWCY